MCNELFASIKNRTVPYGRRANNVYVCCNSYDGYYNRCFSEATKAVEEAVISDKFTMVIRDDGPPNGRKRRKPETVATIDFPGYYQFALKIDRAEGQGT